MNLKMIDENPELKEELSKLFQLMGEEEGHKQGIKDREAKGEVSPATGQPGRRSDSGGPLGLALNSLFGWGEPKAPNEQQIATQLPALDASMDAQPSRQLDISAQPVSSGSHSTRRASQSGAVQVPGQYGIPPELQDQLHTPGAYDYITMDRPRAENESYNLSKASLMEKILMGGGAAALVAAAIRGKRVNPKLVGTMMGMGFGAAQGAPQNYYRNQARRNEAAESRFDKEQKQDNFMAQLGMQSGGYGLRGTEMDMRAEGKFRSPVKPGGADDLTMEKMLTRAIRTGDFSQLKRAGRYQGLTQAEMYDRAYQDLMIMKFGSTRVGGMNLRTGMLDVENPDDLINIPTTPSTSQVGRAEKDLQKAKNEAALGVGETLWETVPEEPATSAIEGWARDRKGYPIAPEDTTVMNDIISRGGTGDLRKKYPVTGQGVPLLGWGSDVFHGDTLGTNPDLITAAQGFKDLIPMGTGDWMKQHPKFYGQDSTQVEAKRDALNAMGMGVQLPEWATAEGLKTQEEALTHLETLRAQGLPQDLYDDMLRELGIDVNNGR